jgi:hypothetical protein
VPPIATHPAHPSARYERHRRVALGPPPAVDGVRQPDDDSERLVILLGVFTIAMVAVVAALLAAAAVDTWWALVLLMVVHFAMTGLSFAAVMYVFSGNLRAPRAPRPRGRS